MRVGAEGDGNLADGDASRSMHFAENAEVVLLHRLLKLTNRLMAPFSMHLSHRHKISLNEFRLLMTVGALGQTASHEVAELTGVNAMSISRAVATLQRHGRLQVTRDESNRRRKWLSLTEEGERLYQIMRPQTQTVAHYLFSELEPGELAGFESIVERLIERLDATDEMGRSLFLESTRPDAANPGAPAPDEEPQK
jgi:DNA-binding MarR family transcriptional regulator